MRSSSPNGIQRTTRPAAAGAGPRVAAAPAAGHGALGTLLALATIVAWGVLIAFAGEARAESQPSRTSVLPAVSAAPPAAPRSLDQLLVVPARHAPTSEAAITDQAIAAAVERGDDGLRPKRSGFRKRNIDLFRTEHPVEIDGEEMLLRFRLRAKSRETMSVELRF